MQNKNEIFSFLKDIPNSSKDEIFETIVSNDNIKIERIISYGQITKKDFWYNQDDDEFIYIIQGESKIKYDDGTVHILNTNDSLYIKAHQKHQVIYTSNPAVWLAIFIPSGTKH